jgi:hypothetical protein
MTTSTNDGEALNAMRMANNIVREAGITWQDALRQGVVHETNITLRRGAPMAHGAQAAPQDDWGGIAPHLKDRVIIGTMFRAVYAQPRSDNEEFWQFMDSIHAHFQKHQSLTAGQYRALQNCYRRVMRRPA